MPVKEICTTKPNTHALLPESRKAFLKFNKNIEEVDFLKYEQNTSLIKKFAYYEKIPNFKLEFKAMGIKNTILWCEHYGILPTYLINELKAKPLAFKNWSSLNNADKLLLKTIPNEWIPSVYQFDDFCFIRKFCPVEIPTIADIIPIPKDGGYKQVTFEWLDNLGFFWEARVHQPIPGSPFFNNGQVWVINVRIKGPTIGSARSYNDVYLGNGEFHIYKNSSGSWRSIISKQKQGLPLTIEESNILERGHFKAK
jgi:hypothetical protein